MKSVLDMHLHMEYDYTPDYSKKEWVPKVRHYKDEDTDNVVYIGPVKVAVDVPEDFDPTAQQVAALERLREKVQAEFTAKLNEINTRISNLQALTYEVPA